MILFFYNVALLVVLVLGLPFWLWRIATTQKYRHGLRARLGRVPARLASGEKVYGEVVVAAPGHFTFIA